MTQPCAIFDADDTLWKTQELFDIAIDRFEHIMYCQGFNPREAHETMMEINVSLANQYGMRVANFADAMVRTYDLFCQGLGIYYSREISRQIRAIGDIPYTSPVELHDGARETLEALREQNYRLILCTAGDNSTQIRKLEQSGLKDYFERVYIVTRKTYQVFDDIVDENSLIRSCTYMIGNSVRSDINPATTAELRCFWLNQGTWAHDHEPMAYPWKVYRIDKLADVLDYLCVHQFSA